MPPRQNSWKRRIRDAISSDSVGVSVQAIESVPVDGVFRQEMLLHLVENGAVVPAGQWIDAAHSSPEMMQCLDRLALSWLFCRRGLTNQYWVNVSGHSLEDARYQWFVASLLEQGNLRADQVVVEVTEQAQTGVQSLATLKALRSFGCGVAIDDFGAGFNSAKKLVEFPCTALKLTGDLCRAVEQERPYQVIEAFIGMGVAMGLETVVEWVETHSQFELLRGLGARLFQGWHFGASRPITGPREEWSQNLEPLRAPYPPGPAGYYPPILCRDSRSA